MSRVLNHYGEPLPVTYRRWLGAWGGIFDWGFAIGSHDPGCGWRTWSWFAMILDRDLYANMDRRFTVTVAGRTFGVSWNWSPWSYPEEQWGLREAFYPRRFEFYRTKLERYDRD